MKNLIYQYWDGNLRPGGIAGTANMRKYAERIGVDFLFEHNPRFVTNLGGYSPHYGSFKPIYTDSFHEYDNVLFTDTDLFAIEGLTESIFDGFNAEIGICTEPLQPKLRQNGGMITSALDEQWAKVVETKWNVKMPRNDEGLLKVYNSGVVVYSNKGLKAARDKFVPFKEYVDLITSTRGLINFYTADQNYIHAMLQVAKMDYIELDNEWNSFIHLVRDPATGKKVPNDTRNEKTKLVHIQMQGADHFDAEKLYRMTNLPKSEWNL